MFRSFWGSGYCLGLGFRVLGHLPGAELTTVRVEAAFLWGGEYC